MGRKKKPAVRVAPDFLQKEHRSLLRKNRQTIYFNDKEMEVIRTYCERFGIRKRSVLYRQAIISLLLEELDKNHPTLF